ncbi:DUF3581 domain-containing protein [Shewanella sp. A32]|uniref:DUF3581 domain-containing protein n=1 Tax=Shewanella sp. A32 TaxID=3031327 RepID=UPI0023B8D2BC|nr:DUF3581 domain-containing protein [Shewanella sp. A32]MDF0533118.1 DUF3581 domain-containing protein [Shewanella sp. A32]
MFLTNYFKKENNNIVISRKQASDFAKDIAGDFNPLHDEDAKRFCVPGDLLFALVLDKYGLSSKMQFRFEGMVGDAVPLHFPDACGEQVCIEDEKGKSYLKVSREGEQRYCEKQLEAFIRSYVAFSGLNFIHVLVPLMQEYQVMINPERPLVIYETMSFELDILAFEEMTLELVNKQLQVDGKRGDVLLEFALLSGEQQVGTGRKTMVLSGLRPYEQNGLNGMITEYQRRSEARL